MPQILSRRSFLKTSVQTAAALGLASLVNIPPFLRRALADGSIGANGKKLLFIFLRGGNDGVNNVIPIMDPSYAANRAVLSLPRDPIVQYDIATGACDLQPRNYPYGIRLGNAFAALHPAMSDVAPLFNTGKLALIHRVAYRSQSRSHFDSEKYWEKASDGTTANRLISDGLWYRTIVESGWNRTHALAGVSIQSNMPQSLRGIEPMTNLSSIARYNLLGVYSPVGSTNTDRSKLLTSIDQANQAPYPEKDNRSFVYGLGDAFKDTLDIFQDPTNNFTSNEFYDADGTTHLFPINSADDERGLGSGAYSFFTNLKAAAQVLANTDAIIAGTELGGFDTHTAQATSGSPHLGAHANLLRRVAWAFHALWRFFSNPANSSRGVAWNDVVIVTMSEFGRTSAENASVGTDHAEASVMYIGGGAVSGGVYGCGLSQRNGVNEWDPGTGGKDGSLFAANNNVGYLKRIIDYRSVLGEIIRDHLGATQGQLEHIIPAYSSEAAEHLKMGGTVGSTPIVGELGIV
jgi:uncharacterized protein (DUF1501 family)